MATTITAQAMVRGTARLCVIRYLGNGRWTALGIVRRLLKGDGFIGSQWDDDRWLNELLEGMVADRVIERRECSIDMPNDKKLIYFEYRLTPNADGSDHANR